jgi:hypothetical protein
MPSKQQIKMIQMAAKAAGLRCNGQDGRYYLLLAQYKRPDGSRVKSCKDLNNSQIEDFLAICESYGWRCPGKEENHFRKKVAKNHNLASFAQQSAIMKLRDDLGWGDLQLAGMVKRMTNNRTGSITLLSSHDAYNVIEAMKNMFMRSTGKKYSNLCDIKDEMEAVTDGQKTQIG